MKPILIRNVPKGLIAKIDQQAAQFGISRQLYLLGMLENITQLPMLPQTYLSQVLKVTGASSDEICSLFAVTGIAHSASPSLTRSEMLAIHDAKARFLAHAMSGDIEQDSPWYQSLGDLGTCAMTSSIVGETRTRFTEDLPLVEDARGVPCET